MTGIYVILAELKEEQEIQVGKKNRFVLRKGFYAYVGSALVSLENRLARHIRSEKKLYWHIDYLVNRAEVRTAIYAETSEKKECLIAQALASRLPPVFGFGCSDCHCDSHLFFSRDLTTLRRRVVTAFKELNLKPKNKTISLDST